MSAATLDAADEIRIRAAVNEWIGETFKAHRKHLAHTRPEYCRRNRAWMVRLVAQRIDGAPPFELEGNVYVSSEATVIDATIDFSEVRREIDRLLSAEPGVQEHPGVLTGEGFEFCYGDGVAGIAKRPEKSIELLLTDPPYGISNPYSCENQVSRRLRKNGADFIMPKGDFGAWDRAVDPEAWTAEVLPRISGWAVIFCAQAQIGQYTDILTRHKFNSVGTLVWKKTNPVPFNHRHKPINSWEALVVGKRPGTKFNGHAVHNVFTCKSPSPQQRIHPTQKPLELMHEFVKLFSSKGELACDPFGGAATTLIAAVQAGRKALVYENDRAIYQRAKARVLDLLPRMAAGDNPVSRQWITSSQRSVGSPM